MKYINEAKAAVFGYVKNELHKDIGLADIYVVWACHILGNEKYMLSTDLLDTRYYEVTVSATGDVFLDAYVKERNHRLSLDNLLEQLLRYWSN